jgi:hypothetical protein
MEPFMASPQPVLRPSQPHIRFKGALCPVCDRPIPNEKAEQVQTRIEARDRAAAEAGTLRMKEQFAAERVQIEANARVVLEQAQREGAAAIETIRKESAAAIEILNSEARQKETAAREEGARAAQSAAQQQIAVLTQAKADADAAAKEKIKTLTQENAEVRTAAREQVNQAIRGKAEVEAAALERIAAAEAAKLAAENEAKAAKESHEAVMNQRLQEQREAMDKASATALSARDAKHFDENQKLKDKLDEAVRKLEQKTADELGEGAHLDLLEELKDRFEGDRIRRVPKGVAGADIIHEIIEEGKVCGKIVYDSKNRNAWRSEYATKLCEDKSAEGADHAVLSLLKFPAETRQLEIRDGVILANPARVAVIAEILRDSIVRSHGLRLSNKEREKKKGELYAYITGERFRQHLDSIESHTDKLLDIDVAEEKAHRKVWETRGTVVKTLIEIAKAKRENEKVLDTHNYSEAETRDAFIGVFNPSQVTELLSAIAKVRATAA